MPFINHKFYYCLYGYHCSFLGLYYFHLVIIRSKSMQPIIKKVGMMFMLQIYIYIYIFSSLCRCTNEYKVLQRFQFFRINRFAQTFIFRVQ